MVSRLRLTTIALFIFPLLTSNLGFAQDDKALVLVRYGDVSFKIAYFEPVPRCPMGVRPNYQSVSTFAGSVDGHLFALDSDYRVLKMTGLAPRKDPPEKSMFPWRPLIPPQKSARTSPKLFLRKQKFPRVNFIP